MPDKAIRERHKALMRRMGVVVGLDPDCALDAGRVTLEQIDTALSRCTRCSGADACADWLGAQRAGAALPPAFCANGRFWAEIGATGL